MLAPDRVLPFLTDDRAHVRRHALRYFEDAAAPAMPLTADHLWLAIDRFGMEEASAFLHQLAEPDVPQTQASFDRLVAVLSDHAAEMDQYHLQNAIGCIDLGLLREHRESLLANERIVPHVREHLEQRLELAEWPAETLWDALLEHGNSLEGKHAGKFDGRVAERYVEALARSAEAGDGATELAGRAVAALCDPRVIDTWNEVFLVQFLGRVRHEPAIDLLVEKLLIDGADILNEEAYAALSRIGTLDVVRKVEAAYAGKEWGVRLFAREPLHRIKRAESEAALLRLLECERDDDLRRILLSDLCELGSMAGLEAARGVVAANPRNPENRDLCAAMLSTAIMNGVELSEAADWTRVAERDEAHSRRLRREMREGFVEEMRDQWLRTGRLADPHGDEDEAGDDRLAPFFDPLEAIGEPPLMIGVETYRRESPKVGRNDPCPCGSGKKYKKCCGGG